MENLVEIDRKSIIAMGGSQYVLIPQALKRENSTEPGDELVFFRAPGSTDVIVRIEKRPNGKGVQAG